MATISELVGKLLEKAGADLTDPKYKSILAIQEVVDDTLIATADSLMTLEVAKIHPEVKNHHFAQSMKTIDMKLNDFAEKNNLTSEQLDVLKMERSTPKRLELFNQFLHENKEKAIEELKKATKSGDKGDIEIAKQELAKLNSEILAIKESSAKEKEQLMQQFESERLNLELEKVINSYKWSDAYSDSEIKKTIFETKLNKKLSELGGKLVRKDGKLTLIKQDSEDLLLTHDNKTLDFQSLADSLMSENKLIQAVTPNATTGTPNNPTSGQAPNTPKFNPTFSNSILGALQDVTNK